MKHELQLEIWIREDNKRMTALQIARDLQLNDWCLAAGFVRNLIWDRLHKLTTPTPLNDIDLVYFDLGTITEQQDMNFEKKLKAVSLLPWSVKNQARMHHRNNDNPYSSTPDAMSYWPEVETAIGISLSANDELIITAPFGLSPLFNNTITMNPKRPKPKEFSARIESKEWLKIWPKLKQQP